MSRGENGQLCNTTLPCPTDVAKTAARLRPNKHSAIYREKWRTLPCPALLQIYVAN